ncbi:type II toxin-antitoxin system PemK/MazF family toxin [Motilibacter aurantiacus]|uniref:type II toxin-antitoxin system PemK/MazF family toxin n=1 Tax=Motilibacter aurantiacus TaxID=2714955 RepID=UPI00140C2BF0|nr:type II toxin-antitoxin system PemK/MazF family toxin [Motilibacter aurantiacus]NHC43931.1 type II toxin-antitoxin system PemK/MazF family toxin [Motilibacter aurantiacus]
MATSRYALLGRLLDRLVARPSRARPAPRAARGAGARTPPTTVPARRHAGRTVSYSPRLDGRADPGEVVWAWVAYEDDPRQGKDRPVLVVGRQGATVLGLMLSSQHDRDGQRHWLALGPGTWDREGRPSWVRLDRVLAIDERSIRREGAVLDRRRFDAVAGELRTGYGWR